MIWISLRNQSLHSTKSQEIVVSKHWSQFGSFSAIIIPDAFEDIPCAAQGDHLPSLEISKCQWRK